MRCGACRGEHATVAGVRACHTTGAVVTGPNGVRLAVGTPQAVLGPAPPEDPFDAVITVLVAAGFSVEVLLDLRNARRRR